MKRLPHYLTASLVGLLLLGSAPALYGQQSDAVLPYQGYLTDTAGTPLDGTVNLTFKLYDTALGGTALWTEGQANVPLDEGVFSVMLGSREALDGVDFDGPRYLSVSINGGEALTPRVVLGAAPVSLYAQAVADGAAVRSLNGFTDDVTLEAGDNITLTQTGGTITIDGEAAEAFALPYEGTNTTDEAAFTISTGNAPGIVVHANGDADALTASASGVGHAASITHLGGGEPGFALNAVSFSHGGTGRFEQFGIEGYAGLFMSPNPFNPFPTLMVGKEDLDIATDDFVNDAVVVRGDAPILGIYGKFEANTRTGMVLAGVNDNGSVVDKWGIVRQFFSGNGLSFTYGLDPDPMQNATVMSLSTVSGSNALVVPNGSILAPDGPVTGEGLTSTRTLGSAARPAEGGVYTDNVVYAWAHVQADGKATDSFGCTVTRTATGSYRVTFERELPDGVSAIVTPATLNDPIIATAVANGSSVQVATRTFNGAFVFADSAFYIQVVGRP